MRRVELVCSKHPKYRGVHAPKTDCIICWKIYAANLYEKLQELKK